MQLAFALAQQAAGNTSPNPAVGAVLVKDGKIIAQGHTHPAGEQHAEVHALQQAGDDAKGSTLYVTLEPCAHYGRTPPCSKAIVDAGVAEVHYAVGDPNPKVNGRGRKYLQDHGVRVYANVQPDAGLDQNRAFFHYVTHGLPHVTLKYAMTLDGKISTVAGESKWITGSDARQHGHILRNRSDAILVGVDTIIADDPQLTTRLDLDKVNHPLRVVLDSTLRIPLSAKVLSPELPGNTLLVTTAAADPAKEAALVAAGIAVVQTDTDRHGRVDIHSMLRLLAERDVVSLMVEGGAQVLGSFVSSGVAQEIWTFIAPKIVGGATAKTPVGGDGIAVLQNALQFEIKEVNRFGPDLWIRSQLPQA